MKIVVAPDSFKESLSAEDVAAAIREGFAEIFPAADYVSVPVADGGEGTVAALIAATGGRRIDVRVSGPLGEPVEAFYGLTGDGRTAVVEAAAAAGLTLVPPARRDPSITTTFGVGRILRAALDAGARRFVVGIGGSATNDAGAGMVQALGGRLFDVEGRDLAPGGGALAGLAGIDLSGLDPRLAESTIEVACDVDNPLVGPFGASAMFGPQKGASPDMVVTLDAALRRFARIVREQIGVDVETMPGGGAAGGLGAGAVALLGARLCPGVEVVTRAAGLDAVVRDADLVVTGEGRIDGQTVHGKTPVGVAAVARRYGRPVIAIAGSLGEGAEAVFDHGIAAIFPVVPRPCTLGEALAEAAPNLRRTARAVAATLALAGFGRTTESRDGAAGHAGFAAVVSRREGVG